MRPSAISLAAIVASCLVPPPAVGAQQAMLLRYRPVPGHVTRTLSTYTVAMTFKDLMGEGLPQDAGTLSVEAEFLQSITDRVGAVGEAGEAVTVERTVDSTRATVRVAGLAQSGLADPHARATARVVLNDRLEVLDFAITGADTVSEFVETALRAPIGYEFALPEDTIRPGDTWTATLRFPFQGLEDGTDAAPGLDTAVVATATFRLDSLVTRGGDTLAYLDVRGRFDPVTIDETAVGGFSGSGRISGALAGTVIWSAGWNAFGSGAIRALIEMDLAVLQDDQRAALTIAFDLVHRFEIRP